MFRQMQEKCFSSVVDDDLITPSTMRIEFLQVIFYFTSFEIFLVNYSVIPRRFNLTCEDVSYKL